MAIWNGMSMLGVKMVDFSDIKKDINKQSKKDTKSIIEQSRSYFAREDTINGYRGGASKILLKYGSQTQTIKAGTRHGNRVGN